MASLQGLGEPLVVDSRPVALTGWSATSFGRSATSFGRPFVVAFDKLAQTFAKCVLRVRFRKETFQTLGFDEAAQEVAWPLLVLGLLTVAMLSSTAATLHYLHDINQGLAPSCVAFEFDVKSTEWVIDQRSDWNQQHVKSYLDMEKNFADVKYEYAVLVGRDSKGQEVLIEEQLAPWDADVTSLEFPLFLTVWLENGIKVSHVLKANILAQWTNLPWLLLSWTSLWGWFHLPVFGPAGHILQLGCGSMIVYSAAVALMSPAKAHPLMNEQQLQNFHRCSGNPQGLMVLFWVSIFQTVLAVLLVLAASPVGISFRHLIKLSKTTQHRIKVRCATEDYGDSLCSICLELLSSKESKPVEVCSGVFRQVSGAPDEIWQLPCSHAYHKQCILPWLKRGITEEIRELQEASLGTCPQCRGTN